MTLIIVEGVDRAGKSTYVKKLMREKREKPRLKLHFDAPGANGSERIIDEMWLAMEMADRWPHVDFVWDRGHLSWFIYEGMYRDPLRGTLANMKRWEDAAYNVLRRVDVEVHLVHAGLETTLNRDDGQSTWTRPTREESKEALRLEQLRFLEHWEKSRWRKTAVDTSPKEVPA